MYNGYFLATSIDRISKYMNQSRLRVATLYLWHGGKLLRGLVIVGTRSRLVFEQLVINIPTTPILPN